MRKIINNKGFTLVELVVVIAIIAILTTVSIVGYNTFVKNANMSKAEQELAQINNVLRVKAIEGKIAVEEGNIKLTLALLNNKISFIIERVDEAIDTYKNDLTNEVLNDLFDELLQLDEVGLIEFTGPGLDIIEDNGKYYIVRTVDTEQAKLEIIINNQLLD